MQSDGGLTSWSTFSGLKAILSGPAGGVVGYSKTSYDEDEKIPILGFDMGGTSTDVSRYNGTLEHIFETTTAEVTIQSPQLDINTVAAGGGSILSWRKGLFAVGPESASAHPGPACYRKGGPLTVTDANLFLGRIVPDFFPHIFGPNENEPLDTNIVKVKFNELTDAINKDRATMKPLTAEEVAMGFLTVANEAMCRPIRTLTEGKGYAASNHHLSSFGGAGGQHACSVANILGISKVIVHKYSSILSAYGMSLADVVVEAQRPESVTLSENSLPGLESRLDEIAQEAISNLVSQGFEEKNIKVEKYLNLRYNGTETFIMTLKEDGEGFSFAEKFIQKHKLEFGFTLDRDILVGDIRVRAIGQTVLEKGTTPGADIAANGSNFIAVEKLKSTGVTPVYFETHTGEGKWINDTPIYPLKNLSRGDQVKGPAIIIDDTQTILVELNAVATVLTNHVIIDLDTSASLKQDDSTDNLVIDPVQLSVFGHRFMSIAEQMGQTLQKTSISANIKERLDFSCAIFSPDGGLVANAPHIPVHLGSMSTAVEYQKNMWEGKLKPGDVLVANHPAFGGSHLPDITVITPVFDTDGKTIIFWAASRGHHSDIGGITAGSMPPFSKELWEEGAMIKGFKVVENGLFKEDEVVDVLYTQPSKYPGCSGSRSLSDSISDLKAQIAANNKGILLLSDLIKEFGLKTVQFYMYGIQKNAELAVRELLKGICAKFIAEHEDVHGIKRDREDRILLKARDYLDDGTAIELSIAINADTGEALFDFSNTGPQVYGNLNAPRAITQSAILYVLRSLISDDIPLNQGCLEPIEIYIPSGTILSPDADRATVGGNVETSQRITDVILKAFESMGASQGTCNNLTFGYGGATATTSNTSKGRGFGYYETIAGGAGAGPSWDGQSGVQVHMTNTRSTDPEILEKRYPCILHEFSLRRGSGGRGEFCGGDGVVRDIEFRVGVQVSILSERRARAPYGMRGGEDGKCGENLWLKLSNNNKEDNKRALEKQKQYTVISLGGKNTVVMKPGDRIVIKTPGGGGYGDPILYKKREDKKKINSGKKPKGFIPRASGSIVERKLLGESSS